MRAILCFILVACGGLIEGRTTATNDGGSDAQDLLGGGGHLVTGPCRLKVSFKPNDKDWIPLTDSTGITTGTRSNNSFTFLCAATGNEGFYYAFGTDPLVLVVGTQNTMGHMQQTSNGRERENADGQCTVITSDIPVMGRETVSGTFDCQSMRDDPIGWFSLSGSFVAPLP